MSSKDIRIKVELRMPNGKKFYKGVLIKKELLKDIKSDRLDGSILQLYEDLGRGALLVMKGLIK